MSVIWPLTEAQSGLWYASRMAPDNPAFNTAHALRIEGPLDVVAFAAAADDTAREAQSLWLAMRDGVDGPEQWLDPQRIPTLVVVDLQDRADPAAAAEADMRRDLHTAIDPTRNALALQRLYRLGPQQYIWYQRAHHLASDGYGMALWTTRVCERYAAAQTMQAPLNPQQALIDEDAQYRASERRGKDAAFWRAAFTPLPEVAGMASGRAISNGHCLRQVAPVGGDRLQRLLAFARRVEQPWPDVLTALTALYCLRFAGAAQTVLGIPFMGRLGSVSARATATMMNVLPLAVEADADTGIAEVVRELALRQLRARRHGRYRSEQLRRDLGLLGGQRRLHGALINVQPYYRPVELAGVTTDLEILGTGPVDDITIGFRGDGRSVLDLEIEANPDLYSAADVAGHLERLPHFIDAALTAQRLGDVPLASPAEQQRLVFDVNATGHAVPDTTLTALIEARMASCPDAVALEFEGAALTYRDLEARTRALADALRARGAGPDQLVAIALPRSLELLIGLVAILRAGAAYLPLDLAHPPERLARVLELSQPLCVLARQADTNRLPAHAPCFVTDAWPAQAGALQATALQPRHAAYLIYTSGSTGEPKGVLVEHRAIVNRLAWMAAHYGFEPGERILQKTPATFDVSVWEFFLPLIVGATLVIAPPEAHRDPAWLARILRDARIGTCHFVPSMLSAFLDDPAARGLQLRRIFCSGEELPAALRDRLHATLQSELHNLYGPTEAAVDVSYWPASADDSARPVPIGFPVWNTRLYVLDAQMQPLPPGVTGDLYLGGRQLARGYLGRDDLTAERFLADPFRPGERIYKTGDLARWRTDGAVVFLGRSDHQVKLRGLRIELGEIDAALAASPQVARAEVILREDRPGDRRLVAYVQTTGVLDVDALRRQLAARLPDYMMPAAFVAMDHWPVNANGKLDRKALPVPAAATGDDAASGRAPQTPTEIALAALVRETLGLATDAPLGAEADFFDLGGDSLSAVALLRRIQDHWQRSPGLGTLFATPTIAALAAAIDNEEVDYDNGLAPLIQLAAGDPANAPLFVIHPAGGIAWGYRHLARLLARPARGNAGSPQVSSPPSRSVFGLQSPALAPDTPLPASIDDLARAYAERVAAAQPHGPLHLLGWSVGGIIAQAMAVVLRDAGREVGLVALLDAYPADVWRNEPEPTPLQALRALLAVAGHDPEGHPELTTREAVVAFLRDGDTALGHLPASALDGVVRVVTDTNRLIREHRHRHFDGSLLHVRAGRDHALKPQLQARGWAACARRLDTLELPLLHAEMTGPQASSLLAPALAERLAAFDRSPPPPAAPAASTASRASADFTPNSQPVIR